MSRTIFDAAITLPERSWMGDTVNDTSMRRRPAKSLGHGWAGGTSVGMVRAWARFASHTAAGIVAEIRQATQSIRMMSLRLSTASIGFSQTGHCGNATASGVIIGSAHFQS